MTFIIFSFLGEGEGEGERCSVKTEATAFKTNYTVFYENQHFAGV